MVVLLGVSHEEDDRDERVEPLDAAGGKVAMRGEREPIGARRGAWLGGQEIAAAAVAVRHAAPENDGIARSVEAFEGDKDASRGAAQARARERFTVEAMTASTEAVYAQVPTGGPSLRT